jgi:hypothetical protein
MNKPVNEFQATKLRAVLQMAARQLAFQRMRNFERAVDGNFSLSRAKQPAIPF